MVGLQSDHIYADEMNLKFINQSIVCDIMDECFVSSMIFENMDFGKFHCVCASGQMMRTVLSYIKFGYVPYMHTVSCDIMYYNYIDEIFKYIPEFLSNEYSD